MGLFAGTASSLVRALVLVSIVLPTGTVFGHNVKLYLAVASFSVLAPLMLFRPRFDRSELLILAGVAAFLLWSSLWGLAQEVEADSQRSQLTAIVATGLLLYLPIRMIKMGFWTVEGVFEYLLYATWFHLALKVLIEALIVTGLIDPAVVIIGLEWIFGSGGGVITLDLGGFLRLFMASDFLIPGFLYVVLMSAHFGIEMSPTRRAFLLLTGLTALAITYSRYLWLFGALAVVFGIYLRSWGVRPVGRFATIRLTQILAPVLAFGMVLGVPSLHNALQARFAGAESSKSDETRFLINRALQPMVGDRPVLGHGLGGHSEAYVRFPDSPWNYELQWLAFLVQFGGLGIIFIGLMLGILLLNILKSARIGAIGLAALFLMWLASGFVNCFLLTSSAGTVFLQYYLGGKVLQGRRRCTPARSGATECL